MSDHYYTFELILVWGMNRNSYEIELVTTDNNYHSVASFHIVSCQLVVTSIVSRHVLLHWSSCLSWLTCSDTWFCDFWLTIAFAFHMENEEQWHLFGFYPISIYGLNEILKAMDMFIQRPYFRRFRGYR